MQPFYQCRVGYFVEDFDCFANKVFSEGVSRKFASGSLSLPHNVHVMLKVIDEERYIYLLAEVKEHDEFLPQQKFPYNFVLIILGPCPERISKFMEDFQNKAKIELHPAPETFNNQGEIVSKMVGWKEPENLRYSSNLEELVDSLKEADPDNAIVNVLTEITSGVLKNTLTEGYEKNCQIEFINFATVMFISKDTPVIRYISFCIGDRDVKESQKIVREAINGMDWPFDPRITDNDQWMGLLKLIYYHFPLEINSLVVIGIGEKEDGKKVISIWLHPLISYELGIYILKYHLTIKIKEELKSKGIWLPL